MNQFTKKNIILQNIVWTKLGDSRRFQWSKYIVFDDETDFQVKFEQFQRPDANTEEKLP